MLKSFIKLQLNHIKRLFWFLLAMVVRAVCKVNKRKIFFWSYLATKYACNPRAITEYILDVAPNDYDIYWAFEKNVDTSSLHPRIQIVRRYSLSYLYALYTSKFVIYNMTNNIFDSMFVKKRNQKYIMTWHGDVAIKCIMNDAPSSSRKARRNASWDSVMCDLMLSSNKRFTGLIRTAFGYRGEILERCAPRNDIFYNRKKILTVYKKIRQSMGFASDTKIVFYAPTFRDNSVTLEPFCLDWDFIVPCFERMLGGKVEVLIRLHPNIANKIEHMQMIVNRPYIHDVSQANDITEYLLAADAMISDYSSAMFDFSHLRKPCFMYVTDRKEYGHRRGFYLNLEQFPFPIAENKEELKNNIEHFNIRDYEKCLDAFDTEILGREEDGRSCERLLEWMRLNNH